MPYPRIESKIVVQPPGAFLSSTSVSGLIIGVTAAVGKNLPLDKVVSVFSLDGFVSKAADTIDASGLATLVASADYIKVHKSVEQFYRSVGGASLSFILVAQTDSATSATSNNTFAKIFSISTPGGAANKLMDATGGGIYQLGCLFGEVDNAGVLVVSTGSLGEAEEGVAFAQAWAKYNAEETNQLVWVCISLYLKAFATISSFINGSLNTGHNYCSVFSSAEGADVLTDPAIGFILGKVAGTPLQESIARVASGKLAVSSPRFSDPVPATTPQVATREYDTLYDYRHNFFSIHLGTSGVFFSGQSTFTSDTAAINKITAVRTVSKAIRIGSKALTAKIGDNITYDADGTISSATVIDFTALLNIQLDSMREAGELVSFFVDIPKDQNVSGGNIKVGYTLNGYEYVTGVNVSITSA